MACMRSDACENRKGENMQQAIAARTPVHLWIVGILATLWNCFGAYDYVQTRMRNMDYIKSSMPGVESSSSNIRSALARPCWARTKMAASSRVGAWSWVT